MSLQSALTRLVDSPFHNGAALSLWRAGRGAEHLGAGDLTPDRAFFAASATKLYITAILLMLEAEGRVGLHQPFRHFLNGPEVARLNLRGGADRTGEITVAQLMAHTSGLPDYFEPRRRGGLYAGLVEGRDRGWNFADAMEIARRIGAHAAPGAGRRAVYSDTNYQVLGKLIETLEGASMADVIARRIARPLGLSQTWLYVDPTDARPLPLRYGRASLPIPRAMASFQADGGLVTTAREGLAFLRAFFGGGFFPPARLAPLMDWRAMFFPLSYGTGLMRFTLPRLMTGLRRMPEMIGHSGLSGCVLFHAPANGLYVAGTVNQIARPGTAFRLLARAAFGA